MNLITQLEVSENLFRNTGRTTAAVIGCPKGAIYVCMSSGHIEYCKTIAKENGRNDIQFIATLEVAQDVAGSGTSVVIDHAVAYIETKRFLERFYGSVQRRDKEPNPGGGGSLWLRNRKSSDHFGR